MRIELRLDGLRQPSGGRLQDIREPTEKKFPVRTAGWSLLSDRLVEPDQVFDVAFFEPISHPVANSYMFLLGGLYAAKFVLDGVKVPRQNCVLVVMGFHLRDQHSDGVDVAPPEVFSIPFRFYRSGATSTENVCNDSHVHALLFGVPQGLGSDKSGKFCRIAVNPVDRILSIFSKIPVMRLNYRNYS